MPAVVGRIRVGAILGAHGVRGRVTIKSFTARPADVFRYGPVQDEAGARSFRLTPAGTGPKGALVADVEGVTDRDAAEALKGTALYVSRSVLPEPEEDEFYWSDLIGLAVVLDDGEAVGTVTAVHDFGAGTMLEVRRPDAAAVMLPFTRAAVPEVDVKGGRVVARRSTGVFDSEPDAGDRDGESAGKETADDE